MLPIPNDRWVSRQAADARSTFGLPAGATAVIRETANGSLAISGIVPTIVSYVTGAFALLTSEPLNTANYLYIYIAVVLIGALAAIVAAALVLGRSAFSVATGRLRVPFWHFGPTPATMIGYIVYGLNGLLFILSVAVYNKFLPG
jgi:hypothetical protein